MNIDWSLLGRPVDIGAHFQSGMKMGQEMVAKRRKENALAAYMANPDDQTAISALAVNDPDMAYKLAQTRGVTLKAQAEARTQQARRDIGQQYLTDPKAATNAAIGAGEFDLADQLGKLGPEQGKRSAEAMKAGAAVAYRMRQMTDPAQRAAFFAQAKPQLLQMGADPETLEQVDVTNDTQLDAFITLGQNVGDLIDQGRVKWITPGEEGAFAVDDSGRPVGTQNPYARGGAPAPRGARDPLAPQEMPAPSPGMPTEPPQAGKVRIPAYAQMSSGYRDPAKNKSVGGVPDSYHMRRGPDGQPLGRDYVPTGGRSMAQLFVDLKAANPHLDVINEGDHVHIEPKGGQAPAPSGGEPPRITSPQQMASLASGTVFIAPDGSRRVKP